MPQIVRDEQGVEHEFPDEATPEMIAQALGVQLAAPAAPAPAAQSPAPQEDGFLAALTGGAKWLDNLIGYGAQEARRGPANAAGLLVDLAAVPVNLAVGGVNKGLEAAGADYRLPYVDKPVGGSQFLFDATSGFGLIPEVAPQDATTKFVGRVAQELGAAALPMGATRLAAKALGAEGARQMAVTGSNAFKRAVAPLVEQAAANPTAYATKELAAVLGAGAGAGTANAVMDASGYDPNSAAYRAADLAGGLAGSLGVSAASKVLPAVRDATQAFVAPSRETAANKQTAVEALARAAGVEPYAPSAGVAPSTENLANAIAQGNRPGAVIEGFQETLADRLQNPGVAALQYGREAGPRNPQFANLRNANINAVAEAMAGAAPRGNEGALLDAIQQRVTTEVGDIGRLADDATRRADMAAATVRPTYSPEGRGAAIRGSLQQAEDAAQDLVGQAYAKAGVDNLTFDPAPLRAALNRVTESLPEAEKTLVPVDLIDRVSNLGAPPDGVSQMFGKNVVWPSEPVSMREATALRSELLRRQRAALADPRAERGGQNAARIMGEYLNAIEGVMGQALPAETRTAINEARALARSRAETFGRPGSPVAAVLAQREGGRSTVPDSRVAAQFVSPNAGQPIDELFKAADTPDIRAAIRDEILARAGNSVDSADTIRQFVDDYKVPLERFPQVREELMRVADERGTQQMATAMREDVTRTLTDPRASTVARVASYAPEKLPDAMRSVIASRDPAKAADEIMSFVGDRPEAVAGARKAFWDVLKSQAESQANTTGSVQGQRAWNGAALNRFLEDPATAAVAKRLWRDNPEHLGRIKQIAETLKSINVSGRMRAPNSSGTPQGMNRTGILTPESLASRYADVQRGRISPGFFFLSTASVALRRATAARNAGAVAELVDDMLLNPDFAEAMMREYNPANVQAAKRAAKLYLPNRVSHVLETMDGSEDEQQDPLVDALRPEKRP